MFITRKGYIGLAPWNATCGDKVAVISGGYTPFLLQQKAGKDDYVLIGESYMSGLMNGEALNPVNPAMLSLLKLS
jgi:hypothetical protein